MYWVQAYPRLSNLFGFLRIMGSEAETLAVKYERFTFLILLCTFICGLLCLYIRNLIYFESLGIYDTNFCLRWSHNKSVFHQQFLNTFPPRNTYIRIMLLYFSRRAQHMTKARLITSILVTCFMFFLLSCTNWF